MPMYIEGVIRTSVMALFTPRDQLRNMQQHAAAQALINQDRGNSSLMQSLAASLLIGAPVHVVPDNDFLLDDEDLLL